MMDYVLQYYTIKFYYILYLRVSIPGISNFVFGEVISWSLQPSPDILEPGKSCGGESKICGASVTCESWTLLMTPAWEPIEPGCKNKGGYDVNNLTF